MVNCAPSLTLEGIWNFLRDRDIQTQSPENLRSAFDYLEHNEGVLIYRLKPAEEIKKLSVVNAEEESSSIFFKGCVLSDLMQYLATREETEGGYTVCFTHGDEDDDFEAHDVMESYGYYANFEEMKKRPYLNPRILALFPNPP